MTIKAIETRYAGCRFRSRLEARWAVFFDALGIEWDYEPEGYMVGPPDDQRGYLPDFWLPKLRLWVEVKGDLGMEEAERLCRATYWDGGLPESPEGNRDKPALSARRLLLLGPLPRMGSLAGDSWARPTHTALRCNDCDVVAQQIVFIHWPQGKGGAHLADSHEMLIWSDHYDPGFKSGGYPNDHWVDLLTPRTLTTTLDPCVHDAYQAARSARFEHGESG